MGLVVQDVLIPIGVPYAPMLHTREDDGTRGVPIMGWGLFPTVDDLAKIAQLYQDRGTFDGRQLLYADEIDMLLRVDTSRGLSVPWTNDFGRYSYAFSWWYLPYAGADGCKLVIPEMQGYGGNVVTLMPNGMTGIRLADADDDTPGMYDGENMAALADSLRSFCP